MTLYAWLAIVFVSYGYGVHAYGIGVVYGVVLFWIAATVAKRISR